MITPKFSCSQDESAIIITLYVPSVRASEVDIHVDGTEFYVHIHPYFLRLNFPADVSEEEDSFARYDPSTGNLTVRLMKVVKGKNFDGLDLLANLLAPPRIMDGVSVKQKITPRYVTRSIEVMEDDAGTQPEGDHQDRTTRTLDFNLQKEYEILLEAEKNDWRLPQEPLGQSSLDSTNMKFKVNVPYGFQSLYSGFFKHTRYAENSVFELGPHGESASSEERRRLRARHEKEKWDEEHYIADFVNDEEIREIISWNSPFLSTPTSPLFSDEDNLVIMSLPRKEYIMSENQLRELYLTLLQILFAYCYDSRATQFDPTPESAWTICVLTPCFSALDVSISSSPAMVLRSSYIRALTFPLYRNWRLCEQCRVDLADVLQGGRHYVSKALLHVKRILDLHEEYHIYSKIWVNDFIVWTQVYATDNNLQHLSEIVRHLVLTKASLDLSLDELELAAQSVEADSDDEDVLKP
ncbi:hypothetical protein FRC03_010282 [Tulasnella sp. 419]|nr:hypothetical protein FRC02_011248 [Tulasnella sp. 418]KAG8957299.1 hypothetical protein FRC03_010282 [Tulasnella sp. 419]